MNRILGNVEILRHGKKCDRLTVDRAHFYLSMYIICEQFYANLSQKIVSNLNKELVYKKFYIKKILGLKMQS